MAKLQAPGAGAYRPALDDYARRLIARIQRDHADTEAVLALKAHYEAHRDLPSLTNLMEGWAQTLREPEAAADAYLAAADAALAAGDRARARWICRLALERSPQHGAARARLVELEKGPRSVPPPPPRRASSRSDGSSYPPRPISEVRTIERDADWLADEHLTPLEDTAPSRLRRYEETQRIWRP